MVKAVLAGNPQQRVDATVNGSRGCSRRMKTVASRANADAALHTSAKSQVQRVVSSKLSLARSILHNFGLVASVPAHQRILSERKHPRLGAVGVIRQDHGCSINHDSTAVSFGLGGLEMQQR